MIMSKLIKSIVFLVSLWMLHIQFALTIVNDKLDIADGKTLKTVVMIHRHGDRNPVTIGTKNPNREAKNWPDGLGRVTRQGKQRLYGLGLLTRLRYSNFLSFDPNEMHSRSSVMDRCLVSAQMVSAALYPPRLNNQIWSHQIMWQPVPIHAILEQNDTLIEASSACPRILVERLKMEHTPQVKKLRHQMQWIADAAERDLGLNFTYWWKLGWLHTDLNAQNSTNCPTCTLPNWYNSTTKDIIAQAAADAFKLNTYTPLLRQLYTGPMLNETVQRMRKPSIEDVEHIEMQKKLFAYSSHDTEIAALMNTIGIDYQEPPGFACTLFFELHKQLDGKKIVRVFYTPDGGAHQLKEMSMNCHEPKEKFCTFEQFQHMVKEVNQFDYHTECFNVRTDQM